MTRIPAQRSSKRRQAAPYDRWASFGCRCRSSSTELSAHAGVYFVEEGQVEVAVLPERMPVIDARLLALTDDTLLRAWWRHLGQRTRVIKCVDHLDLVVLVIDLGAKNLVARED